MKRITTIFCLLALTALAADVVIWDRAKQSASMGVVDANNVVIKFAAAGGGEDTNRWALSYNKSENGLLYTSQDFTNLFTRTDTAASIFLWVNPTDPGGDAEFGFLETSRANSSDGAWIYEMVNGWGEYYFILRLNSSTETIKSTAGFTLDFDGRWHLIGIVKSNNTYTFSIDATNDTAKTSDVTSAGYGLMAIGDSNPNWGQRGMNGGLRKVMIYNRALSGTEMTNLYNAGAWTTNYPASGMIAYWPCNEGTGTNVADIIGGNTAHFGPAAAPDWINWPQ